MANGWSALGWARQTHAYTCTEHRFLDHGLMDGFRWRTDLAEQHTRAHGTHVSNGHFILWPTNSRERSLFRLHCCRLSVRKRMSGQPNETKCRAHFELLAIDLLHSWVCSNVCRVRVRCIVANDITANDV